MEGQLEYCALCFVPFCARFDQFDSKQERYTSSCTSKSSTSWMPGRTLAVLHFSVEDLLVFCVCCRACLCAPFDLLGFKQKCTHIKLYILRVFIMVSFDVLIPVWCSCCVFGVVLQRIFL